MKIEFKWALILSGLNFSWLLAEFAAGLHTRYISIQPYVTIFSIIIPVWGLRRAILEKRDTSFEKMITFWGSLQTGLLITAMVSVVSVFIIMVYFKVINPEYTQIMANYSVKNSDESVESISQQFYDAMIYYSMKSIMQKAFTGTMFIGLIITIIWSFLIKKREN